MTPYYAILNKLQTQLRAKLEAVGRDPLKMPGVKAMAGEWKGFYRIRHGKGVTH
jgi:hypothetical protein